MASAALLRRPTKAARHRRYLQGDWQQLWCRGGRRCFAVAAASPPAGSANSGTIVGMGALAALSGVLYLYNRGTLSEMVGLSSKITPDEAKVTHVVFLDVSIDKQSARRITIGLFGDVVPLTAENFRQLCTGGTAHPKTGRPLVFAKSPFHRIIPGFMCQGGDITKGNGTGGRATIPGYMDGRGFPDENFDIKHGGIGTLSMANSGPNTNGSQFFLCTGATSWLDGKHVVFGRVLGKESFKVVRGMEAQGSQSGATINPVIVVKSGELVRSAKTLDDSEVGLVEALEAAELVEAAPPPAVRCHAAMQMVLIVLSRFQVDSASRY